MDHEKTGALIAQRRRQLGLTQKALAQQLNISDRTVSKWERGMGFPDIALIEPVADALEISVLELLHGEGAAPEPREEQSAREALQVIRPEVESKLGRARKWTAVLAVLLLAVTVLFGWLLLKNVQGQELGEFEVSAEEALRTSPYVLITLQDLEFMDTLVNSQVVKQYQTAEQSSSRLSDDEIAPFQPLVDPMGLELSYLIVQIYDGGIHVEYGTELIRITLDQDDSGSIEKIAVKWPAPYPYVDGSYVNPDSNMQFEYLVRNFNNEYFQKRVWETGLSAIF